MRRFDYQAGRRPNKSHAVDAPDCLPVLRCDVLQDIASSLSRYPKSRSFVRQTSRMINGAAMLKLWYRRACFCFSRLFLTSVDMWDVATIDMWDVITTDVWDSVITDACLWSMVVGERKLPHHNCFVQLLKGAFLRINRNDFLLHVRCPNRLLLGAGNLLNTAWDNHPASRAPILSLETIHNTTGHIFFLEWLKPLLTEYTMFTAKNVV